ncbi:heavy-metal-associated domain-containing protein [Microbacterium sp. TWP3-1-2b2]|uniref:heavy-metal-associated domain-containing protein n=1 Tax=Microbacterium sp. TWP3-1-2b2 TaxID=2804651 RepID=UPI003CF0E56E
MNAGARLGLFTGGLVVAFGAAFGLAGLLVPQSLVAGWTEGDTVRSHDEGHSDSKTQPAVTSLKGLSLSDGGMVLSPVSAPHATDEEGNLSFRVEETDGSIVTEFAEAHDKKLHLIIVRSDGSEFRHVHPTMDADGTWTIPWTWHEAGSYRAFADFTPEGEDATGVTLTQTIHVDGAFASVPTEASRVDVVDGFTVELDGELVAGSAGDLTVTVSRDGEPVTTLEPYLGAFGHLVALREGDLAYLHVHAEGDEPRAGETAGPEVGFGAEAPTAGRYLLYLDFQVDGAVHTAEFVLDVAHGDHADDSESSDDQTHSDGH